jgi:hypothetical protein
METIEKIERVNVSVIKNDIKKLSEEQRFLKNQRKDVHLKGERILDPKKAAYKHMSNREDLRILYAAYGLMRGKSFSQTENKYSEEEHPLTKFLPRISKVIESYNQIENKNGL